MLLEAINLIIDQSNSTERVENTQLFSQSLNNAELSGLSKWLYWAKKVYDTPLENKELRKWYGAQAYLVYNDPGWREILETNFPEEVEVIDQLVYDQDINSVAVSPSSDEIMFTSDVLFEVPAIGFLKVNPNNGRDILVNQGFDQNEIKSGYIWAAEYSPSGTYVSAYSTEGQMVVWDANTKRLVASTNLNMWMNDISSFINETQILYSNSSSIYLAEINTERKSLDTLNLFQPNNNGEYHKGVSSLVSTSDDRWVAGFSDGLILSGRISGLATEDYEITLNYDESDYDFPVRLVVNKEEGSLIAGYRDEIFWFDLDSNGIPEKEPNRSLRLPIYDQVHLTTLMTSSDGSDIYWSATNFGFSDYIIGLTTGSRSRVIFNSGSGRIYDMDISKDDKFLVTGDDSDFLTVLDLESIDQLNGSWVLNPNTLGITSREMELIKRAIDKDLNPRFARNLLHTISQQ